MSASWESEPGAQTGYKIEGATHYCRECGIYYPSWQIDCPSCANRAMVLAMKKESAVKEEKIQRLIAEKRNRGNLSFSIAVVLFILFLLGFALWLSYAIGQANARLPLP